MGGHSLANGRPVSGRTLAYCAGFLDGEGCFLTVGETACSVSAEGASPLPLLRCRAVFGGTVEFVPRKREDNHARVWRWRVHGENARRCAEVLYPESLNKAPEVEAVALSAAFPASTPFGKWLRERAMYYRHRGKKQ